MGMRDVFRMEIGRFKVAAIGFVAAASLVTASVWWFASAPGGTEEAESRHLAVDAQALAAAVDAPLARFAKLTDSFRPADFSPSDRLAMTARQIRLQGAVPYASATFLANAAGRVVAASAPNPASEADVAQSAWFQRAAAQPPGRLTLQRIDASWLRAGPALLATRSVADESGRLAGVAGAVFSLDDLRSLVMPPWICRRRWRRATRRTARRPWCRSGCRSRCRRPSRRWPRRRRCCRARCRSARRARHTRSD